MHQAPRPSYAVIGQPVAHSLSPALFQWLFAKEGVRADYVAVEVAPAELGAFVHSLREGRYAGASVTMPHKQAIAALVDELHPLARRAGAVNCVVRRGERLIGLNTDVAGVREALRRGGAGPAGSSAVVLGAGGAARAAVVALLEEGASRVWVASRRSASAERLALEADDERVAATPLSSDLQARLDEARVLVNATPVGMAPLHEDTPLPEGTEPHGALTVLDMVYRPLSTPLLRRSAERGATVVDGLWMLVHQALEAGRAWREAAVGDVAPALHAHLAARLTAGGEASLEELRAGIERVDAELLALLRARLRLAEEIGAGKALRGEPVHRPERERELLRAHHETAKELGLSGPFVDDLFRLLFAESRRLQERAAPKTPGELS